MKPIITDILIIGAGGAGLRAALSAHNTNPKPDITVISRGEPGRHGVTAIACSDRMAFHVTFPFTEPAGKLAWVEHARDIYKGGGYVSDPNLADLLARESEAAYNRLAELSVPFALGLGNRPKQFVTDGSKYARACYTGPYTAREIESALLGAVKETDIKLIGGISLAAILRDRDSTRITGALCVTEKNDEWIAIQAKAVILATGGPGGIFEENVFPDGMDASPWFAALRAGATLVNIEFIQFGLSSPATSLACSGSMMRALPRLCANGRDLLSDVKEIAPDHDPIELLFNKGASWPVSAESPANAVDIAVSQAIRRGETVFLDYRMNPDFADHSYLNKHVSEVVRVWYKDRGVLLAENGSTSTPLERLKKINPQVIDWFMNCGIDLASEPVEIRHAAQHFQGGILINTNAETGVPGLYACGETAGGQHGANRPGGNALLDCQVMGHIAGTEAAGWASEADLQDIETAANEKIEELANLFADDDGFAPDEIIKAVRKTLSTTTVRLK